MASDSEIKALAEEVEALKQMEQTPGWQYAKQRLDGVYAKHQNLILLGRLDRDEYLRQCGALFGLSHLLELRQKVEAELDRMIAERKLLSEQGEEEPLAVPA